MFEKMFTKKEKVGRFAYEARPYLVLLIGVVAVFYQASAVMMICSAVCIFSGAYILGLRRQYRRILAVIQQPPMI